LDALVQAIVRQHNIDVVLLVEYVLGGSELPGLLLQDGLVRRPSSRRFGVFVRTAHRFQRLPYKLNDRVNIWKWQAPQGEDGLIALLHGYDRRHYDDSTRRFLFRRVVAALERGEQKWGHQRTVIAGDFNANPFEPAVVDADGLHALGVRSVKASLARRVRPAEEALGFFYNPMWRLYGQESHREAGSATHYWTKEWVHELAWHLLDQVVLRPGECPRFPEDQLRIVTKAGGVALLDGDGVPDSKTASDHLPVIFHWNL
jgi:hypothetical protein